MKLKIPGIRQLRSENRLFISLVLMGLIFGGCFFVTRLPPYYLWGQTIYTAREGERNYQFDGSISREVLESYLSRAITCERLLHRSFFEEQVKGNVSDTIRSIGNIGAKFIGRSILLWNGESILLPLLEDAKPIITQIHSLDPDIILQAAVFETVSNGVESLEIPSWVFEEFGVPVETRNFSFNAMYEVGGPYDDNWGPDTAVPDITKLETKMWVFYLAATYIDIGIEAIHFGQVHLTGYNDPFFLHWQEVITHVRAYATTHARRHMVICDAHTPGIVINGKLLLDFHASPLFPDEIEGKPQEVELHASSFRYYPQIYNKSKGGITPSGWACESLPYLVEFDNYGISTTPGTFTEGDGWVWGYDEITWYAMQTEVFRNDVLRYIVNWLEVNDPNGFLQMPAGRSLAASPNNVRFYFANTNSTSMPFGYNQEETIKGIWQDMPNFYQNL